MRAAADVAAEEADARGEHHLDFGASAKNVEEQRQLIERCGEIRVPETDETRVERGRVKDSAPHRLRFPAVAIEVQHQKPLGIRSMERLDQFQGPVATPIVHETELNAHIIRSECAKGIDGKAPLFVVAGDDEDDVQTNGSLEYAAVEVRSVETVVHGRVLFERRPADRLLVGFHGYAENAERHIAELQKIPGIHGWSLAAIQALHPFYAKRGDEVVASWMTRLDRETAIADNIEYVRRALATIGPEPKTIVFAGFSQGVAMAYRAAATLPAAAGLIVLAGDVPPDVVAANAKLPPVLIGRGDSDDWYSRDKLDRDVTTLRDITDVTTCEFAGGHEWTDEFRAAASKFLSRF